MLTLVISLLVVGWTAAAVIGTVRFIELES